MQKLVQANKGKNLQAFFVFQGGPELKPAIEKIAAEKKVTIPLTFLPQGTGAADYGAYKVHDDAHNTVLLYHHHIVKANFVDVDDKSFPDVSKATEAMLKK